ncbi:amidase family protein [Paenibacillus sp. GP183]|uniref:amidase n=1 Tax=Paenibacillus sp. GP183 TaxID=1882751 RepID=UPI00089799A2|nr:amidase family protein [Paenibacillus sp. GP183]SEB58200.1 amidase [Paenibacillus sp. GP183]
MSDLIFQSASALVHAIRERKISAVEVLEAHLAQIMLHNGQLNAIITLDEQGARRRALAADEALSRDENWGPLHGLPITLKDCHSTIGLRTTAGFTPLNDYVPIEDGTVSARLKAAGGIIIGKSNVPVLLSDYQTNNPIFGRTQNPWNLDRTPGGSSGGAAAALAAGMIPLEIGSDLAGSIRVPAHFCGIFGLKPTERRVSLAGHIPELPGTIRTFRQMACIGPMARNIEDLTLAFKVIAGPDIMDTDVPPVPVNEVPSPALNKLRIAWAASFPGIPVSYEISSAIERLAADLAIMGAKVEHILPDVDWVEQENIFSQIMNNIRS